MTMKGKFAVSQDILKVSFRACRSPYEFVNYYSHSKDRTVQRPDLVPPCSLLYIQRIRTIADPLNVEEVDLGHY